MEEYVTLLYQYLQNAISNIGSFPQAMMAIISNAPPFVYLVFFANFGLLGFVGLCRFLFNR